MGDDLFLLGDVGGTNTRLALGTRDGLRLDSIQRYRNDAFADFSAVLQSYQTNHIDRPIQSTALAIAGPIGGSTATLTNRDWSFDQNRLACEIGCKSVFLTNDMGGLARAIPTLTDAQKIVLRPAASLKTNPQSLVIGLGTGVNVSALLGDTALAAEIGHTGTTQRMATIISNAFGGAQTGFETVEDVLSGRGLERLYRLSAGHAQSAPDICAAAQNGSSTVAQTTCALYGTLLAELIRELALHYLPLNGIYLAGSVARGVLNTGAKPQMINHLSQDHIMNETLNGISLSLITDDAAALHGCLEIAKSAL